MLLFWTIRYLDRTDKQFKDRYLSLNTKSLDPITRAAVELVAENNSSRTEREILKYKHLFTEDTSEAPGNLGDYDRFDCVGPSEYFEDETGREISNNEIAQILTGSPPARSIPAGAKQHDIQLMLAEPKPILLAEVSLTPEEIRLFGYFVRDLRELRESAFMIDGPGSLKWPGGPMLSPAGNPILETAVSDEEIRSFVTIFRRLYMTGAHDPASFVKIVPIAVNALGNHPRSKWIDGTAKDYQRHLNSVPDTRPFVPRGNCTFTTKRLIDVFLYTQYAHQPNADRQRQFGECLAQLNGKNAFLTWMFLVEMLKLSLKIVNAGNFISWWFKAYCDYHNVSPAILSSLRDHHSGLGTAEKEEDRRARLFHEKVEQLAIALWEEAGQPAGGPAQFLAVARDQLTRRMND